MSYQNLHSFGRTNRSLNPDATACSIQTHPRLYNFSSPPHARLSVAPITSKRLTGLSMSHHQFQKSALYEFWEEQGKFFVNHMISGIICLVLGIYLTNSLYFSKNLSIVKLINITGLAFCSIGSLLLSNLFQRLTSVQTFISNYAYSYSLGVLTCFPFGIFLSTTNGLKNNSIKSNHAIPLIIVSIVVFSLGLFMDYCIYKKTYIHRSIRFRAAVLGTFFLFSGCIFQILGAYIDLFI